MHCAEKKSARKVCAERKSTRKVYTARECGSVLGNYARLCSCFVAAVSGHGKLLVKERTKKKRTTEHRKGRQTPIYYADCFGSIFTGVVIVVNDVAVVGCSCPFE